MGKVENGKPSYQWNENGNVKRKWRKIPFRKGFCRVCRVYSSASPSARLTLHSHRLIKYSTISKEIFSRTLPLAIAGCWLPCGGSTDECLASIAFGGGNGGGGGGAGGVGNDNGDYMCSQCHGWQRGCCIPSPAPPPADRKLWQIYLCWHFK